MSKRLTDILEKMDEDELDRIVDFEIKFKEDKKLAKKVRSDTLKKLGISSTKKSIPFVGLKKAMTLVATIIVVLGVGISLDRVEIFPNQIEGEKITEIGSSVVTYDGAKYIVVLEEELEQYNLPSKIEKNMIGDFLGYVDGEDSSTDEESSKLYKYNESKDDKFLIMEDYNGDYVFLVRN